MPERNRKEWALLPWAGDTAAVRGRLAVAPSHIGFTKERQLVAYDFYLLRTTVKEKLAFIRHSFCCKCSVYLFESEDLGL